MFTHLIVDEAGDAVGNGTVPIQHGGHHVQLDFVAQDVFIQASRDYKSLPIHDSTPTEQDSILLHGSLLDELPLIELVDFSASCLVSVLQGQGDVLVRDGHTSPSFKMS